MKKIVLSAFLLGIILPLTYIWAQVATITRLNGEVKVKIADSPWQPAAQNQKVSADAQIETGPNSQCLLAFDSKFENVVAIKENSRLKVEDIKLGRLFLEKGKILTQIDNIDAFSGSPERFSIKTSTVIVGVRGTGWSTEKAKNTDILCFDGTLFSQGLDNQGNTTGQKDIPEGFGLNADEQGALGELFNLTRENLTEWDDFQREVETLQETSADDIDSAQNFAEIDDLRQEQTEDLRQDMFEDLRQERENDKQDSSSGGGGFITSP